MICFLMTCFSRCESWAEWLKSLEVNVDRCLKSKTECVEQAELHVFSDASKGVWSMRLPENVE